MQYNKSHGEYPTRLFELVRDRDYHNITVWCTKHPTDIHDTNYLGFNPMKLAIELNDTNIIKILYEKARAFADTDVDFARCYADPKTYHEILRLIREDLPPEVLNSKPLPLIDDPNVIEYSSEAKYTSL